MLGDRIESALSRAGITPERVERWLGVPCNCEERKLKLNQLEAWAKQSLRLRIESSVRFVLSLLEQ
jgi:hypothetical protein